MDQLVAQIKGLIARRELIMDEIATFSEDELDEPQVEALNSEYSLIEDGLDTIKRLINDRVA